MDELKIFLTLCLFVACAICLVSFGVYLGHLPSRPFIASRPAPEPQNRTVERSYELLPSNRVTITNTDFRDVEVKADFPVTVIVGECQSNYTVQYHCSTEPHDVTVIDTRRVPLFRAPQANDIRITFKTF